MEMRSAFLIIFLLFGCKQAVNDNSESTLLTDSVAVAVSDTLFTKPNIEIQVLETTKDSIAYSEEKIQTFDRTSDDIYPWISFMTEGPSIEREESETFEFFRLVITTSEIYNSIYFEKCSQGLEGGGRRIEWKRLIDDDALSQKFSMRGEFAGVTLVGWRGWNTVVLNIHGDKYIFKNIENELVTVQKEE